MAARKPKTQRDVSNETQSSSPASSSDGDSRLQVHSPESRVVRGYVKEFMERERMQSTNSFDQGDLVNRWRSSVKAVADGEVLRYTLRDIEDLLPGISYSYLSKLHAVATLFSDHRESVTQAGASWYDCYQTHLLMRAVASYRLRQPMDVLAIYLSAKSMYPKVREIYKHPLEYAILLASAKAQADNFLLQRIGGNIEEPTDPKEPVVRDLLDSDGRIRGYGAWREPFMQRLVPAIDRQLRQDYVCLVAKIDETGLPQYLVCLDHDVSDDNQRRLIRALIEWTKRYCEKKKISDEDLEATWAQAVDERTRLLQEAEDTRGHILDIARRDASLRAEVVESSTATEHESDA